MRVANFVICLGKRIVERRALTSATDNHELQVDITLVMKGYEFLYFFSPASQGRKSRLRAAANRANAGPIFIAFRGLQALTAS